MSNIKYIDWYEGLIMKYFLLNKQEVKKDIWINPILIKTKSLVKIKKIRALQKKLDTLLKAVKKDLYDCNAGINDERIQTLLDDNNVTEITSRDYNALLVMSLLDTQEQRIKCCNKSSVLKGKLYGTEIR